MASAYASGIFLSPPREVRIDYAQVAEITNSSSTVGLADSGLIYKSPAEIAKTLDELQALGVNNIRVLVPWAIVEQSDDVYYWAQMDAVMTAAAARNMGVMADINSTPLWAAASNTFPGAGAPPPAKFAEFVQQVVTRYGSTISAYEIWNEPNWAAFYQPINPVTYTALLAAVYPIIKTLDPTATVVAGALGAGQSTPWTMNPVDFVAGMMAAGAGAYFDALSFHPYQESLKFSAGYTYPGLGTPLEQLDAIKTLLGVGKSVWISEYGLPTSNVSQQQQADYIKDLLDYWQGYSQTGPVFLYTTQDSQTGSTDPEQNYGLFTTDWTPKLAAEMLKAWIAAHPQTPVIGGPTGPGLAQQNPIAGILQAIAQQIAQVINSITSLGQTIVTAITNFVSSITAALSGILTPLAPSTPVAPLALRMASVESSATALAASTAQDTESSTTSVDDGSATEVAKPALAKVAAVVAAPAVDAGMVAAPVAEAVVVTRTPIDTAEVVKPVAQAEVTEEVAVEAQTPFAPATPTATEPASITTASSSTSDEVATGSPTTSEPSDRTSGAASKPAKAAATETGNRQASSSRTDCDEAGTDTPHRQRNNGATSGERRSANAAASHSAASSASSSESSAGSDAGGSTTSSGSED